MTSILIANQNKYDIKVAKTLNIVIIVKYELYADTVIYISAFTTIKIINIYKIILFINFTLFIVFMKSVIKKASKFLAFYRFPAFAF
jgi:hypothetical protein